MISPAIIMPNNINHQDFLNGILNIYAATEPVQAPVIGSGIATNKIKAQ